MNLPVSGSIQPVLAIIPLDTVICRSEVSAFPNAQQGPDVDVPVGHALLMRPRSTQGGNAAAYVAGSLAELAVEATRIRIQRSDLAPLKFYVSNMNQIWFSFNLGAGILMDFWVE